MTPVTSVAHVLEALQRTKAGAAAFCTNLFATQGKLQGWISHGELLGEIRDHSAFFTRKDRDFWHLYFCASDAATLRREIGNLPCLKLERLAVDVVGNEAGVSELLGVVAPAGFRPYARLLRLVRASQPSPPCASVDGTEVVGADQADQETIMNLLESCFDRYADQLPMPYEVEAAIEAKQILVIKCQGALAALLYFETQGLTSTVRYWVVAEAFRSHRFGAALIRHYFAAQSAVRRFILWVTAANEDAASKYRHYGYNPDSLVDQVLVNELIPG